MLGLGCIDTKSPAVESLEAIADLIRRALTLLPPERVVIHPDCGLRMLPREAVQAKLRAMTSAARQFAAT
jgi:5-methyltetrahydropteroyltriglutamate--homocysteine methyltransferase